MVAIEKPVQVSAAGIFGVVIFLAGIGMLGFNFKLGLLAILVGLVVGIVGRPSQTLLVCPACKNSIHL